MPTYVLYANIYDSLHVLTNYIYISVHKGLTGYYSPRICYLTFVPGQISGQRLPAYTAPNLIKYYGSQILCDNIEEISIN